MKRIALFTVVLILIAWGWFAFAETPPKSYTPSEVQSLRLKVAQQAALIAQRDANDAQKRFQESLAELRGEADKVKRENKWGDNVTFDMGTLTFAAPTEPPKPAPAPAAKEKP